MHAGFPRATWCATPCCGSLPCLEVRTRVPLKSEFLPLVALAVVFTFPYGADGVAQTASPAPTPSAQLTSEQDHQRMMDLLHITSLRRGADGDPKSPNAANYDEAKANPYPHLPDPLVLENGS